MFVDELETAQGLSKISKVSPNFAVWSRDTQETCLHMILKKSHSKALFGLGSESELKVGSQGLRGFNIYRESQKS